ncbi:MAG: ATP-binding protein [Elusimicrobiota bacterium]
MSWLKKVINIKLFYKFLIILLLLSVVPVVIVGLRLIEINRRGLQDVILELHTEQATSISDNVDSYVKNLQERIRFIIASHGEPPINWTLTRRMLRSMISSSEEILTVSTVNSDGRELTKVFHPDLEGKVKLVNRAQDSTFNSAKESGEFEVSKVYYKDGTPRINSVYPFTDNMYLYIESSLMELLEEVKNTTIGQTGYAYIVDKNGKIVMHPDSNMLEKSISDRPIVQEVLSRKLIGSKEYTTEDNKEMVGSYAPIPAFEWGVIVEQDKEEAYLSVSRMRNNALVLLIIVIFIAGVAGYFLAQNLSKPILKLTEASRSIASGNFEVTSLSKWLKKVKVKDELVELASTFIVMTQQLKRYNDMQAEKLDAILFSIMDGIIMTDSSGEIQLTNPRTKKLLDIDLEQNLEGMDIKNVIERPEIAESLEEVEDEEKEHIVKEMDLSEGEDLKFLRTDTSIVVHSDSGTRMGLVMVIRDITLEKELEQLKDDFIHSITHDLRSPMTSIRGFLEFLLDETAGEINDQQREFLEIIDNSSQRLLNMINNILDIAKMETGTMPMDVSSVNVSEIVDDVIKSLSSQSKKDKVELKKKELNEIPKQLIADEGLLQRAIINLVSNSLKFTPEGGSVTVKLEDMEEYLKVSVEDTGEGMPEEYVDKIFDRFEQVKGSEGKRKGTGLGLTITKYIIEAHEGEIWAESELGVGSEFIFKISKNLEEESEEEESTGDEEETQGKLPEDSGSGSKEKSEKDSSGEIEEKPQEEHSENNSKTDSPDNKEENKNSD